MDQGDDADTAAACRICRDEGTDDEPLFYPCKCSGSIKYIHKACLDEWLKHSQDQHCGTCKEKFAYRTIYKTDTPRFALVATTLREMVGRASRPVATAARAGLVLALWFIVLPLVVYWTLLLLLDLAEQDAPWATRARFVVARSWTEWYSSPRAVSSSDVLWHTGLCSIPDGWLDRMYVCALVLIKPLLAVVGRIPAVDFSSAQVDGVLDFAFEALIQVLEGLVLVAFGYCAKFLLSELLGYVASKYTEYGPQQPQPAAAPGNHANAQDDLVQGLHRRADELIEELRQAADNLRIIRQQIEDRINRRELGVTGMLFYGISIRALRHYFAIMFGIQLMVVLGVVVPFAAGRLLIDAGVLTVIDYPLAAYGWLRIFLAGASAGSVIESAEWMVILHVLGRIGESPALVGCASICAAIVIWIDACGMGPAAVQGISSVVEAVRANTVGARMAAYLRETTANTAANGPAGRMAAIHIGYAGTLLAVWVISGHLSTLQLRPQLARGGWVVHKAINLALTFVACLLLLPLAIGASLHMSLAPVLATSPLDTILGAQGSDALVYEAWYWVIGLAIACLVSRAATQWRLHTRPGFMWYMSGPDSRDDALEHSGLTKSPLGVAAMWTKSVVLLIVAVFSMLTVVVHFAAATAPAMFPARLDESGFYFNTTNAVLVPVAVAVLVSARRFICATTSKLFAHISAAVARFLRMTEYVTGTRAVSDEGRWVLKRAQWLNLWFVRPLMPADVVDKALDAMPDVLDRARAHDWRNAVPTNVYYAQLQHAINNALDASHPHLAFIVEPRNARVPNVNFLLKHAPRRVAVFVDDEGRARDPLHDYETADTPILRRIAIEQGIPVPAAAPYDDKEDLRFKRSDYCVMYLAPLEDIREVTYLGLVQVAVGVVAVEALISLWLVGRVVSGTLYGELGSGVALVSLGVLVVAASYAVAQFLVRLWRLAHGAGAVREVMQAMYTACKVAWRAAIVLAVFAGAIPLLACYAVEVYWGTTFTAGIQAAPGAGLLHTLQAVVRRQMVIVLSGYFMYLVLTRRAGALVQDVIDAVSRGPQRWPVQRWLVRYAGPAIGALVALCALPLGLTLQDAAHRGALSASMIWDVVQLRDTVILARYTRIALLAIAGVAVVVKAVALYASCAELVRNRMCAVDRELVNIDGSRAPAPRQPPAHAAASDV
ncbi:hypothetical protein H4R19_001796 [Coemansia spiralis]|nr:hypothetical protein H4R19_001796 [Coemansia spiralis]